MNKKIVRWEDIRKFLANELKETKSIQTFGTIGSLNLDHDIDIIITKKPTARASGFYFEIHSLFDSVNSYLRKNFNKKLIRFST